MRQVFSSARIENVEAVAQLLQQHDIETRITNGRGWRGAIRGNFSYRDSNQAKQERPGVWIVRSEDHPRARALLREHGLLESSRAPDMSYLPPSVHTQKIGRGASAPTARRTMRINLILIALIAAIAGLTMFGARRSGWWKTPPIAATVSAPHAIGASHGQMPVVTPQVHRIATPPMLAEMLVARESLPPPRQICLSVDGDAPSTETVRRLQARDIQVQAESKCAAMPLIHIEVGDYRTDGSGVGTVRLHVHLPHATPHIQQLQVERERNTWRVLAQ